MKKPAHWLLAFGVALAISGCGDDDDKADDSGSGGGGAGTASSSAGKGGSGGSAAGRGGAGGGSSSSGSTVEGGLCDGDMDCTGDLKCVISAFDDDTIATVCARPCTTDSSCKSGEFCNTLTGKPADAHCFSTQTAALGPCGPGDTSVCADQLVCLPDFAAEEPVGTCFNLCKLPSTTSMSAAVLETCPSGQSCIDVGVGTVGVCGNPVGRGETCAITGGNLCNTGDICITEVSMGMAVSSVCFQDCTLDNMCADGKTCTTVDPSGQDQTKFCM